VDGEAGEGVRKGAGHRWLFCHAKAKGPERRLRASGRARRDDYSRRSKILKSLFSASTMSSRRA
jgi:hypothetical protein